MGNLIVVAVACLLFAVVIRNTTNWREESRPQRRPTWLGPDPAEVERSLRAQLEKRLAGLGSQALRDSPALQELANHHAHDMAVRDFDGSVDPDGVDLDLRRDRLHPHWVGRALQRQSRTPWSGSPEADRLAEQLLDGLSTNGSDSFEAAVHRGTWTDWGLSVGVEGHMACACLVLGEHWAIVDHEPWAAATEGHWTVGGRLAEGVEHGDLGIRVCQASSVANLEFTEDGEDSRRFTCTFADPTEGGGEGWVFVRGEVSGRKRGPPGS